MDYTTIKIDTAIYKLAKLMAVREKRSLKVTVQICIEDRYKNLKAKVTK